MGKPKGSCVQVYRTNAMGREAGHFLNLMWYLNYLTKKKKNKVIRPYVIFTLPREIKRRRCLSMALHLK